MIETNSPAELRRRLKRIEAVLGSAMIGEPAPDAAQIARYYRRCRRAYRLLHSRQGFVHVGLSDGQRFRPGDLRASAELVGAEILQMQRRPLRVLELAPGPGANSGYLARRFPGAEFHGIVLSLEPLPASRRCSNYTQVQGDYHDLSRFPDASFDLVFVVEALCYSERKGEVLAQVVRKLRPGGRFVVIDGYASANADRAADEERREPDELYQLYDRARLWTDRSMALPRMEAIDSFRRTIARSALRVIVERDLSQRTLPTLRRFERRARIYFGWPGAARALNLLLPAELTRNAAAAWLMRPLVERSAYVYCLHILERPLES